MNEVFCLGVVGVFGALCYGLGYSAAKMNESAEKPKGRRYESAEDY